MHLDGSCHCGNITVRLETERTPGELPIRICGCSFCLKHRPRFTSDPAGVLALRFADEHVSRYRFALRLADFLVCKTCGVFAAAFREGRAVLNIETLTRASEFTAAPTRFEAYNTEDVATRIARWKQSWTPASIAPR